MDRAKRLGEGSIPRLLLTFSAPAVVGMVAQAMYNIVDRAFVGKAVGKLGLAAAGVSFPFMLIVMAFGMLVGLGAAALVSMRLGAQDRDGAERVLGHAVVLLAGVSLPLTVIGLAYLEPLLRLFGASPQVLPYASQYLQVIALGVVFQTVGFGLNAVIRAEGNPRIAMFTMLIGALLNVILNPIFLFGFGWGMRGSAAATVVSQAISTAWVLRYFLGGRSLLKLHARNLWPHWSTCAAILAVGSPSFAMQVAASVLNTILNNQLRAYGGDLAISVMCIVYAVAVFLVMPIAGINQGAQPIIGYNYGARKFDRVKKTLQTAILAASGITVAGFVVVMIFPAHIVWLFNRDDPELLWLGTHALRICLAMLPIIGFQIVGASYFQAVGKPKHAIFLSLSRQVLLLIPAVLLLPRVFGLNGVWASMPVADAGSSLLTGTWLFLELRRLGRRDTQTPVAEPQLAVFIE